MRKLECFLEVESKYSMLWNSFQSLRFWCLSNLFIFNFIVYEIVYKHTLLPSLRCNILIGLIQSGHTWLPISEIGMKTRGRRTRQAQEMVHCPVKVTVPNSLIEILIWFWITETPFYIQGTGQTRILTWNWTNWVIFVILSDLIYSICLSNHL